jgi:hypothetical protein
MFIPSVASLSGHKSFPSVWKHTFPVSAGVLDIKLLQVTRENQKIIFRKLNSLLLSFNKGICLQGGAKELGSLKQRAVNVEGISLGPTMTGIVGEEAILRFYVSPET